jgi:hypothetical protein
MLGLQADLLDGALDFGRQRCGRLLWLDAGPKRAAVPLLELADSGDPQGKGIAPDALKRGCNVVCNRPLDFANEPQREMKLFIAHPPQRRAVVHRVDQQVANGFRRSDCDEEPVHDF